MLGVVGWEFGIRGGGGGGGGSQKKDRGVRMEGFCIRNFMVWHFQGLEILGENGWFEISVWCLWINVLFYVCEVFGFVDCLDKGLINDI